MTWYNISGSVNLNGSLAQYATYRNHVASGIITIVPNWSAPLADWMRFGLRRFGYSGQYSNSLEVPEANKDSPKVFTHGSGNTSFPGGSLPPHLGGYERYALNARRKFVAAAGDDQYSTWSGTLNI